MPRDNPFLQAILDNPDDDTPRLVYADWLDEHADHRRAEFIRLQCKLATLDTTDPRRGELETTSFALLMWKWAAWVADLPQLAVEKCQPFFDRGFVAGLNCTVTRFLKIASRVFQVAPIRRVTLRQERAGSGCWDKLARCCHLTRLRELEILASNLDDRGTDILAASPYLGNLRHLQLSGNHIGDRGAVSLACSSHLQQLLGLDLRGRNPIGDLGRLALRNRFGDRVLLPE